MQTNGDSSDILSPYSLLLCSVSCNSLLPIVVDVCKAVVEVLKNAFREISRSLAQSTSTDDKSETRRLTLLLSHFTTTCHYSI